LLARVDAGASLAQLQRGLLVPLELEIMSDEKALRWNPRQFVASVLGVLPEEDRR
jgi:hypothetical protein